MITIDIAKDFAKEPGARTYSDGAFSGEEFYDKLLKPKYLEALNSNQPIQIIIDGTEGFASSFLNEAFRRLGQEFGPEEVLKRLLLISNEVPKYISKIKNSLYEKSK